MIFRINPAFDRYSQDAVLVGRILSSFGEIEASVCRNATHATSLGNTLWKTLYAIRVTSTRLNTADRLMRPAFEANGLGEDYSVMMGMVWHCHKIRNQYAHCNWADHIAGGLFFADLQDSAETQDFSHSYRHVDMPLLTAQFEYFNWTMEWLEFTHSEMAKKMGDPPSLNWPRPKVQAQVPLHNPPAEHIPPWISEDEKALHLARARAAQGGDPTPTPAQQALERRREEKRAQQEEQRRKSREGEQRAKERSDPSQQK